MEEQDQRQSHSVASNELKKSSFTQSKPVHVDIRARDTYQHHVQAEAGDLISWSFFTRRKNIAFGLFYLYHNTTTNSNSKTTGSSSSPTSSPAKYKESHFINREEVTFGDNKSQSISGTFRDSLASERSLAITGYHHAITTTDSKDIVVASRGSVFIMPPASPKPGHGSTTSFPVSRANSVVRPSMLSNIGLDDKNGIATTTTTNGNDGGDLNELSRSKTIDSRTTTGSDLVSTLRFNTSVPELRTISPFATTNIAPTTAPSISAPNAVEYIEVLPIERYESFQATISGHYEAPVNGTFVLYFDNSYSINTTKELFLTVNVGPIVPPTQEVLSGWLLKRKQRKLQGWARRWFQLDRKGILSYFADRFSPCRGSVNLNACTITKIPQKLMITVDSESQTYHLKAYSVEDYSRWSEQFTFVRSQPMTETSGEVAPIGTVLKYSEKIHEKLITSEKLLFDLRRLATEEDNGNIRYLAPLEKTFQSLQELYDSLSDYAIFLQRTGRRMSQVSTGNNRAALLAHAPNLEAHLSYSEDIPEGEEFFDAEEIILTEVSDDDFGDTEHEQGLTFLTGDVDSMTIDSSSRDALNIANESLLEVDDNVQGALIAATTPTELTAKDAISNSLPSSIGFRTRMPRVAPACNVSLSSILRKSIGKDWSTISMPVALNEPLSVLQRLCEELEYSHLLDKAAQCESSLDRMVLIVAFAVSAYAATVHRADRKPFTPLLGETFEYERMDRGYKFIAEKVCHRPLTVACHAQSKNWSFWQDQKVRNKFWGKSMEYIPTGNVHVSFPDTGDHFVWTKVITCVRNLLSGKKWVENYGDMKIKNERTGDVAKVTFKSNSSGFFGISDVEISNQVVATITPSSNQGQKGNPIILKGRWDSMLCKEQVDSVPEIIWQASAVPNDHIEYFGFTEFAITLNELSESSSRHLPITDSRLRPDQRMLEEGKMEEAETLKTQLEQQQRELRQEMEQTGKKWQPRWFILSNPTKDDPEGAWRIKDPEEYWHCRENGKWPSLKELW